MGGGRRVEGKKDEEENLGRSLDDDAKFVRLNLNLGEFCSMRRPRSLQKKESLNMDGPLFPSLNFLVYYLS